MAVLSEQTPVTNAHGQEIKYHLYMSDADMVAFVGAIDMTIAAGKRLGKDENDALMKHLCHFERLLKSAGVWNI